MKRLLCFILILTMMIPTAFASDGDMVLSVSEAIGGVGDIVTVACRVTDAPECASFRIIMTYDSTCLAPISGKLGSGASGQTSLNTSATFQGKGAVVAVAASSGVSLSGEAELFLVDFEILAAPEGGSSIPLTISYQEFFSADLKRIIPTVQSGTVYLNTFLPGDVNEDRQVDLLDAAILLRKLGGTLPVYQEETFFLLAADVMDTGDNEVNTADVARLLQYITGVREEGALVKLHAATSMPTIRL